MSGSLNKVIIVGNLGQSPEVRSMQNGDKVATLSIATTESWKDQSGQKKERTEWHRVVIFGKVAEIAERYLKKGSKVLVEGQLQTRKWEKDGEARYTTEIILSGPRAVLTMLDSAKSDDGGYSDNRPAQDYSTDLDDDLPF